MNTNDGQLYRLNSWANSGAKWALLLNMPDISRKTKLENINESAEPGRKNSYKRQKIESWSIARIAGGGNAEIYTDVTFGPFTDKIPVTHVGIASSEDNSGILYMFTPIDYFVKNNEPLVFGAGEVFSISLREEQV